MEKQTLKRIDANEPIKSLILMPRVIRASEAPRYLGIDKNKFNRIVRPCVTAVRLGPQSIGYDRLELDRWWEEYKSCHGQPGVKQQGGNQEWAKEISQDLNCVRVSGISTRSYVDGGFAKALEQVIGKKQKQS